MIQLHTLPKIVKRSNRRVGRGSGSGRGKTAGRGTKGQKARGSIKAGFEGGQLPLIKRLPLYRGRGRNKSFRLKFLVVNLKILNILPKDTVVTKELLVTHHILREEDAKEYTVKILGEGDLIHPLTITLPISKRAAKKVEAVGGKVTLPTQNSKKEAGST